MEGPKLLNFKIGGPILGKKSENSGTKTAIKPKIYISWYHLSKEVILLLTLPFV